MAQMRSVNFLPEIFQTDANKQFLAATLDQLTQEPKFKQTQGYIGRHLGPGVDPNGKYIQELTPVRRNYQLEPGVVSRDSNTGNTLDAITYPGMVDALETNGADVSQQTELYSSEYYTFDPFVNYDSFVNYSQYYWLPGGPKVVNIDADPVPIGSTFTVNRTSTGYQFNGIVGNNPTITLVRGGSYNFSIDQIPTATINYRVSNNGTVAYVIEQQQNPTLTLVRGNTYVFTMDCVGLFPFYIKTSYTLGTADQFNDGVLNNGSATATVTFTVPATAPDVLYYQAGNEYTMRGQLNIIDPTTNTGPKFWIQSKPSVDGQDPSTPNINVRNVYGAVNNGIDFGTLILNAPSKTAQQFYYDLDYYGSVDLLTGLDYDQVNGIELTTFINTYGGIDGITNLQGRTVVFTSANGWGAVPLSLRYQVWRINYQTVGDTVFLQLANIATIGLQQKFDILFGDEYANTQWYKLNSGVFSQIPLLSAVQDTLYYQDSENPAFYGIIRLIEPADQGKIFIDEILGKQNYTGPNGVVFTNGLKVRFTAPTSPNIYSSVATVITCTQTTETINFITCLSTADLIVGQQIIFTGDVFGGLTANAIYYIKEIINSSQFTISQVPFGFVVPVTSSFGSMTGTASSNREFYVSGVGSSIELLPVDNFITPESYVVPAEDSSAGGEPTDQDYLTIDRASKDQNAWSRSNRWFHLEVIKATAAYNNTELVIDNDQRAKRPILEFRPGIRLFNMGTEAKAPIDIIDFSETDAFSNIEGSTSYSVNGYTLVEGSRIIFANDDDSQVQNNIYQVEFVTPDTVAPLIPQPIIVLTLADDGVIQTDNCVVCLGGNQAGTTYWFNGITWIAAQQKTAVQQAPLFDIFDSPDSTGISLSNRVKYPSSTFVGSKLFSYAPGIGPVDSVLGFQLEYSALGSIGDIVFTNNLYNDTFVYVTGNTSSVVNIGTGTPREYSNRTSYTPLLGWQTGVINSFSPQQLEFTYQGIPLVLDVAASQETSVPAVKVFIENVFQDPATYVVTIGTDSTQIRFLNEPVIDSNIIVEVITSQVSKSGFYQVPINLQNNPFNNNSSGFTLGTIRTHYESICQNLNAFSGIINGTNNTRDLGNIVPYGLTILQQSAPLTLAGYFLRSEKYNIFNALQFASQEYAKFKNQLLNAVNSLTLNFETPGQVLDNALAEVIYGKIEQSPFYWSDMIPAGSRVTNTTYVISNTTTTVFDTLQVYNYSSANFLGMNVYLNNQLLIRGYDYTVATDGPRITVLVDLSLDDVLLLQEFSATYGNFVPNTPTKLGLYPAWKPQIIVVKTTTGTQQMIQGHDGSQTPVFGDIRDQVLLEFETRVFSNLKLDGNPVPLTAVDVVPGQFRNTGYTYQTINGILGESFLSYVSWNKLDYTTQQYNAANEFTYNYRNAQNKLTNENLLGAWRGIYRYFYDTQQPETSPWEMLGLTQKPTWWEITYGPAPYTSDNTVLWDDLAAGIIRDPDGAYVDTNYIRPELLKVLPVNSNGELLPPFQTVMSGYENNKFRQSWAVGDGGPVEASWWNSSDYPFAIMRLLALTRPAKFFSLFADRDLYRYNTTFNQYLYNNRYRLDANGIQVYGDGVSKASYIDWIIDYNRVLGVNSTADLELSLKNIDVRLCYRLGGFSDKQYLKIYTEKSSPTTTNTSLLLPDDTYDLFVYKNQPFARSVYSSVIIKREPTGYSVYGYSSTQPFFKAYQSVPVGTFRTFLSGGATVSVPTSYTDTIIQIPYGYTFNTTAQVSDFLLSYGRYLDTLGFEFKDYENGYTLNWPQMVDEFLYWSNQGWGVGSLINLNPLASGLEITKEQAVVDNINTQTQEKLLLDQNKNEFATRNINIVRLDNTLTLQPLNDQSLSYADLRYTSYEHIVVFNNASVFGDLVFDPTTGARQSRLLLIGSVSSEWNGTVDAKGFILNQDTVPTWDPVKKYTKGELVKYKNVYWSALTIVQPSATFNYADWTQSDYTLIERGLLPNIANKADQLANSYNVNVANLEVDNDLLSYGLIGFRPRTYFAALNLDDVSQVNLYKQFTGTKGTLGSVQLLAPADFGKETADYSVYENWAILRATYGANANRSYFDLRLNKGLLNSDPCLVQVINPDEASLADQSILLSNVWKSSFKLTTPDILPTTYTLPTDISLPTAGYVNVDDVDITVFSIDDLNNLRANINKINVGASVWVAKINSYDWNVYRIENVPGRIEHVCDNLNSTCRVIFSDQHGLTPGQTLVIRFFDNRVDGVYTVLSVPTLNEVSIALVLTGGQTVINGIGVGFTLQTQRVAQASDILTLPFAKKILPGAKVWVDDNGAGLWEVLEKQEPFVFRDPEYLLRPKWLDATEQYGASVAQTLNKNSLFVGSPRYGFASGNNQKGGIYVYFKGTSNQYTPVTVAENADTIMSLDTTGVKGLGNSLSAGFRDWAVAGASQSLGPSGQANNGYVTVIYQDFATTGLGQNPYKFWQLLTSPEYPNNTNAGEFGYAVTMSQDENWFYASAPGFNQVYAYGKVPVTNQFVRYTADGTTSSVYIGASIQINNANQISITVDSTALMLGTDYTVSVDFGTVAFTTPPPSGKLVTILRNFEKQLDYGYYLNVSAAGGAGSGVKFTVIRQRGEVGQPGATFGGVSVSNGGNGYAIGNTLTINKNDFGGGGAGSSNLVITVTNIGTGGTITAVSVTSYTPPTTLASEFELWPYLFSADNLYAFTILVDGVIQRPNIDYEYQGDYSSLDLNDLKFYNSPAQGAKIVARAESYFKLVDTIQPQGLASNARFGHSLSCTADGRQVIIGSKNETVDGLVEAGKSYVYNRNVQRFIYGQDTSSVTFTINGTLNDPVAVSVNNIPLVNEQYGVVNQSNSFVVSGNTVTILADLNVGDIIDIETNQFALVQEIIQQSYDAAGTTVDYPTEFTNFGQAVDIVNNGSSLYIGAPQNSEQSWKGGAVQRNLSQSQIFGAITSKNVLPALTAGDTLQINYQEVAVPTPSTVAGLAAAISAEVPNVTATASANGLLTIAIKNLDAVPLRNKLQIAPGAIGTAWNDLGFDVYVYTQTIFSPIVNDFAAFGYSLSADATGAMLVVGAPEGTLVLPTTFDYDEALQEPTTTFDGNGTEFYSLKIQSGAVYTYDFLPDADVTDITSNGKYVFGQQIGNDLAQPLDTFGIAVDYKSGLLAVGAPGNDAGDSAAAFGAVFLFDNATESPAWTVSRLQQPVVDIRLLNSVFMYDRVTGANTEYFDFFDPLQGKVLGAAQENIDYIGAIDPAGYNVGPLNNTNMPWGPDHVGEIWWDIGTVRFIDPNQDDIVYASRRWGQTFPGSSVDIYQWVASSVPPVNYVGTGTVANVNNYTINTSLTGEGIFATTYYFWVKNITTTSTLLGKTLSASSVAQYISNPRSSGISYVAPINSSTVAIYNGLQYIEAQDTIISIEFDQQLTDANVHTEYELIAQGRDDAFLSSTLYRKFLDSFCGVDAAGNLVPDPNLPVSQRYGVQFRPRQSMFANRYLALKNYILRTNRILAQYPVSETRSFELLNSSEPIPAAGSGAWNFQVVNLDVLGYQNIYTVPIGYKYLVDSDSDNNGRWTIYTVTASQANPLIRELVLTRVQNYVTQDYWSYINWYQVGYNPNTQIIAEVPLYANLSSLTLAEAPVGSSVKVTANSGGKWEIYIRTAVGWDRVGLQDGTIEIAAVIYDYALGRFGFDIEVFDAQYFDEEPVIETRKILQAINQQLFIEDLLLERNKNLILMFDFILSEFQAPEWLIKTSLIDVDHRIRALLPFPNYVQDNQEFVTDYIQEVKPYHVQVREFNLTYNGTDPFAGDLTDFDLPAYWNNNVEVPQFTSPVLLPYTHATAQPSNINSDTESNDPIWTAWPWSQWYNNYTLHVDSVIIINGGSGYTTAPLVVITGDATESATMYATINDSGAVIGVTIENNGSGYLTTPTITFVGGNGTGAAAYPVMTNGLVRSFKTVIRYDRYQYQSQITDWQPNVSYDNGTLVRYNNTVWEAASSDGSTAVEGPTFDLTNWTPVPASALSGIDRTMGFYNPGVDQPGIDLPLLINGVDYPGVQVFGPDFLSSTPLDAVYASSFTDQYLGTRPTDINVNGGEFIGPYEGHAPEELINGSEYDTLDFRVYTRPGSDWTGDGHGFATRTARYFYNVAEPTYFWGDAIITAPVVVLVYNATTQTDLTLGTDYTVDYANQTVTMVNASNDDIINIQIYSLGGGSELFRQNYTGADFANDTVIIPVNAAQIQQLAVIVNGQAETGATWSAYYPNTAWAITNSYSRLDVVTYGGSYFRAIVDVPVGVEITNTAYWTLFVPTTLSLIEFNSSYSASDGVFVAALGYTSPVQYGWSTPQTQNVVVDGTIAATKTITLSNYVGGSNPANMVVTRNGLRLRPYECIEWFGDDSSISFGLPQRGGYSQQIINSATDVTVWVDNILQVQSVGSVVGDYVVTNWSGSNVPGRQVVFNTPPDSGAIILISVSTTADYYVAGNLLEISAPLNQNDQVAVTTWNDTAQQDISTLVFQGPVYTGTSVEEGYDDTLFDEGTVSGGPGTFSYQIGTIIADNNFFLNRYATPNRLWVTLDGYRLSEGNDFTVSGEYLILSSGAIGAAQVLAVTEFTENLVPDALTFRIFQDMRGVQATYRITAPTTTTLAQDLSATADVIYVDDAGTLNEPDLAQGLFGAISIDGERILYRVRDLANNTLSGLQRGTGGTGAADHTAGTNVYGFGVDNLMPAQYQDYVVSKTTVADGTTTVFSADNITTSTFSGSFDSFARSLEVYVGGTRQYAYGDTSATSQYRYNVISGTPAQIQFVVNYDVTPQLTPPPNGVEVSILQRRGVTWYAPGATTPSDGIALQETNTIPARFLRGL
jgi:hypothetical protein